MDPLGAFFEKIRKNLRVNRTNAIQWLSPVVLALSIALPRLVALDRLVTPDEHLWLARSANYYMALSTGNLSWTYQSEHPGVTVMWAGMAGILARYPKYRSSGLGRVYPNEFDRYWDKVKKVSTLDLLVTSRIFIILGHTLILLLGYAYASRLVGVLPGFLSFLLIAFEPYHVALTRLLQMDGLIGNLMLLSLLAIFYFLERRRLIDLVVSAIAAGLGLLTKSPAVLMAPVVGLLTVYALWKQGGGQGHRFSWLAKTVFRISATWGVVMVLTVVALWPAMWVRPIQTISAMVIQGAGHFETDANTPRFFNGRIIPSNDFGIRFWYFYPVSYGLRSSPVVLVGLVLGIWAYLRKQAPLDSSTPRFTFLGLLIFNLLFTTALSPGDSKFDRYLLPVYAPFDIIAGLGWSALILYWWRIARHGILKFAPQGLASIVIVLQAVLMLSTYPYYLTFFNPLLGGVRQAARILPVGWGEGLDQAAQYLNKKPNPGQLKVLSYLASGCFSYFFKGKTREISFSQDLTDDEWQKYLSSDYVVIYIAQQQRKIGSPILEDVARLNPEYTIRINGLDYVQIYKLSSEP